jgi:NAD(P)-dependent dehydrogenase (short-subunit alcohol dehydrogenase family)
MTNAFLHQTVIISGGIGDIGYATAQAFAEQGANIALGDVKSYKEAEAFLSSLKKYNVTSTYHQVDVTNAIAVKTWVDEIARLIKTPTIVIANAATVTQARIHEITPEQWSAELRVNLDGAFYLTQYCTACMLTAGLAGRVVFVGSWAADKVHQHIPAYSVSKAGLSMLCRCMAVELAPHSILVNEIAPGYVDAGLTGRAWNNNPGEREKSIALVPVQKVISAVEVASQIVNLCRPENIHITGTTLLMDGGLSLL